MTIALQVSDLDHARIDGTRIYIHELLRRFGSLAPETRFALYHQRPFNSVFSPPTFTNYEEHRLPFPFAWMQTRFAAHLFRNPPERLFLPIQAGPLFLPTKLPVTATIHDLAFRRFPETFPLTHRVKLNLLLETIVRRANRLIAVSDSTRRDLLEFFPNLSPERVQVIHHGFNQEYFGHLLTVEEISLQLAPYALRPGSYILYVGALQPRKNLVRLIRAFEQLKDQHPEATLVLAGEAAWLAREIFAARERSVYRDAIVLTGRTSFEAVRALYQGARIFAFPSLYEGFGLPLLEAFAARVPVLTATNSSLPEVAGDAALYCAAEDVHDMAEKLATLWTDTTLREQLIRLGGQRLQEFSWDTCARETLACIVEA